MSQLDCAAARSTAHLSFIYQCTECSDQDGYTAEDAARILGHEHVTEFLKRKREMLEHDRHKGMDEIINITVPVLRDNDNLHCHF